MDSHEILKRTKKTPLPRPGHENLAWLESRSALAGLFVVSLILSPSVTSRHGRSSESLDPSRATPLNGDSLCTAAASKSRRDLVV